MPLLYQKPKTEAPAPQTGKTKPVMPVSPTPIVQRQQTSGLLSFQKILAALPPSNQLAPVVDQSSWSRPIESPDQAPLQLKRLLEDTKFSELEGIVSTTGDDTDELEILIDEIKNYDAIDNPLEKKKFLDEFDITLEGTFPHEAAALIKKISENYEAEKLAVAIEITNAQRLARTQAREQLRQDRTRILQILRDDYPAGSREANTMEWILKGKTRVFVLGIPGDAGLYPGMGYTKYFPDPGTGQGDLLGPLPTYALNYRDDLMNNDILTLPSGIAGQQEDGKITILNAAAKSNPDIIEILTHEVQHDADKHYGRDAMSGAGGVLDSSASQEEKEAKILATKALQTYKTEYRAYSFQIPTKHSDKDDRNRNQHKTAKQVLDAAEDGGRTYAFSERQLAICQHILQHYNLPARMWRENPRVSEYETFRMSVANYWRAGDEGFNPLNSVRIDDVYKALDALGAKKIVPGELQTYGTNIAQVQTPSGPDSMLLDQLRDAMAALTKEEHTYVVNSPLYREKFSKHVTEEAESTLPKTWGKVQWARVQKELDKYQDWFHAAGDGDTDYYKNPFKVAVKQLNSSTIPLFKTLVTHHSAEYEYIHVLAPLASYRQSMLNNKKDLGKPFLDEDAALWQTREEEILIMLDTQIKRVIASL